MKSRGSEWSLFPVSGVSDGRCACGQLCSSPGKHPHFPLAPHGLKDATKDRSVFARWKALYPRMNVGIVAGSASDLAILDVDGEAGETSLRELEAAHGPLPATYTVTTGRGRHLYFDDDGRSVPNSASKVGKNLDVRGEGGYVVGPGSRHISGSAYTVVDPHAELAMLPDWLRALMAPPVNRQPTELANQRSAAPEAPAAPLVARDPAQVDRSMARARAYLRVLPGAVSGQGGHDTCWKAALHLRGFDLDEGEVFGLLWSEYNPRCEPPWSERELRHKVADAFSKAKTPAGFHLDGDAPAVPSAPVTPPPALVTTAKSGYQWLLEVYEEMISGTPPPSVPCGLASIDKWIIGMMPRLTYLIAADTGQGKTAMATQWMSSCLKYGVPAMMFSMEMTAHEVLWRIAAQRLGIEKYSQISGKQTAALAHLIGEFKPIGDCFTVDDRGKLTLAEMAERTKAWIAKSEAHGWRTGPFPGVLFVDYLQLAGSTKKNATKEQEVSEVSEGLKALAKECGIAIVSLVQLNRSGEIRHSGQILQDADVSMHIRTPAPKQVEARPSGGGPVVRMPSQQKPEVDPEKPTRDMEVWMEKNRSGAKHFTIPLVFHGPHTLFVDPNGGY